MTVRNADGSLACICHEHYPECRCVAQDGTKPELSAPQRRFLSLHARRIVDRWQWRMLNSQMQACAGKFTATLWRRELDDLIGRRLMRQGLGVSVHITDAGKAAL